MVCIFKLYEIISTKNRFKTMKEYKQDRNVIYEDKENI